MGALDDISVKISNYKCFAGEAQGFESIKPINLIIGKNNYDIRPGRVYFIFPWFDITRNEENQGPLP